MFGEHNAYLDDCFAEHGSRFEDMRNGHRSEIDAQFEALDGYGAALDGHRVDLDARLQQMSYEHGGNYAALLEMMNERGSNASALRDELFGKIGEVSDAHVSRHVEFEAKLAEMSDTHTARATRPWRT